MTSTLKAIQRIMASGQRLSNRTISACSCSIEEREEGLNRKLLKPLHNSVKNNSQLAENQPSVALDIVALARHSEPKKMIRNDTCV